MWNNVRYSHFLTANEPRMTPGLSPVHSLLILHYETWSGYPGWPRPTPLHIKLPKRNGISKEGKQIAGHWKGRHASVRNWTTWDDHRPALRVELDDGWPESGGRWSFEDVNISSCKVVIIISWWNLEDDKIRTVWLDDEDPNVWRQDVVSKYEDLKMKVKM